MNNKNKYGYYFEYNNVENNNKIIYLTQNGFKLYFKEKHNIHVYKQPDEAFIIISANNYNIKILEKKKSKC